MRILMMIARVTWFLLTAAGVGVAIAAAVSNSAHAKTNIFEGLPATCRVVTYHLLVDAEGNEYMETHLTDLKGTVVQVIDGEYFKINFKKHMEELKLTERFNAYEQDRNIEDCKFRAADILGSK